MSVLLKASLIFLMAIGSIVYAEEGALLIESVVDDSSVGWRTLSADEGVPIGSHVRLNIATGERFVKEVDDQLETLERVLRSLPEPDPRLPSMFDVGKLGPEEYKRQMMEVWKARQVEIKMAMDSMDNHITQMQNYVYKLVNGSLGQVDDESLMGTLQIVDSMVQDIDHALNFANMGGLIACVQLLGHSNPLVRSLAAETIGSAVKNHAELQSKAFKIGVFQSLMVSFDSLMPCTQTETECAKLLYAIGGILRGHGESMTQAMSEKLPNYLARIVGQSDPSKKSFRPVLVKALALIDDAYSMVDQEPTCEVPQELCPLLQKSASEYMVDFEIDLDLAIKFKRSLIAAKCDTSALEHVDIE